MKSNLGDCVEALEQAGNTEYEVVRTIAFIYLEPWDFVVLFWEAVKWKLQRWRRN